MFPDNLTRARSNARPEWCQESQRPRPSIQLPYVASRWTGPPRCCANSVAQSSSWPANPASNQKAWLAPVGS